MALRDIITDPKADVLHKKARPVALVDDAVRTLLDDMAQTLYHAGGGGLAAPQVGILRRLVVIDDGSGLIQLVNPVIVSAEGEQRVPEACLSIPGRPGIVARPARVTVAALGPDGELLRVEGTGYLARALCHEIDHLDGILFIEKVLPGMIEEG